MCVTVVSSLEGCLYFYIWVVYICDLSSQVWVFFQR